MGNLSEPRRTILLEEPDNLLAGEELDAGNGLLVSDDDTDLGWGETFLGHGDDEFADALGGVGDPLGGPALEWSDGGADSLALALGLHSAHCFGW